MSIKSQQEESSFHKQPQITTTTIHSGCCSHATFPPLAFPPHCLSSVSPSLVILSSVHPVIQPNGLGVEVLRMLNSGVNKGSVVVIKMKWEGTAGHNAGVDYAPDFKNSTLNSGEQQRVKGGQKNFPF